MSCQFLPSGPNDGREPPADRCLVTAAAPAVAYCRAEVDQSPVTSSALLRRRRKFKQTLGDGSLGAVDEIGEDTLFGNVDEALEAARQRLQPAGV